MTEAQKEKSLPGIGVLGGSFNPIHNGHLIIAQALVEELSLAEVLFLLSARPPHKETSAIASWQDRLEMIRLAVEDNPLFQVSELEIQRQGRSYTAETMEQLKLAYGHSHRIFFVVGADSILEIFTWRHPERLLESGSLVVAPRPGCELSQIDPRVAEKVTILKTPLIEISSSDIRQRISLGRSIRYLVPDRVAEYIAQRRLYQ
jgi:nicotinate-nucleotide adenylyltransferase